MIRAFARVRQELERDNCPVPRLTIYGEGDCRPQLEALVAELQLADFVCLPGVSKHIADHLKEADIYLMSSNYEGMSIALLEAMAAGLPIAVTAVSGTKDLLIDGENACISPVGDQAALAASIMRFIRSPELRERCGHRAEESARQFGISACAAKHLELYRSLTHGSSATCNE
jgi:glycosyltransferase involved in cell wall biosynthesis